MNTEAPQKDQDQDQVPLSENKKKQEIPMVPFSELLQFATTSDKILMALGGFAAFVNGSAMPLFSVIFGEMSDSFGPNATKDEIVEQAGTNSIYFTIVGVGTFILSFAMFATWMITGERQAIQFRQRYFRAILRQEVGWFDTINPNELASKVANETFAIQGAIGEKVATFIMTLSMSFFGFLIGFVYGWQLALVIMASIPAMSISASLIVVVLQNEQAATAAAYSNAGGIAEEALNGIKTVKMLDGEDFTCNKYGSLLLEAAKTSMKYSGFQGLAFGFVWAVMIWSYSLGFWYGAKLISDQTVNDNNGGMYTVGDVLIIFFAILTGGFSLGQAGPCVQSFIGGRTQAVKVIEIIRREPRIQNPMNPKKIQDFRGEVVLKNVEFTYPNRPEQQVLGVMNIRIPAGKKVALVGESGCGKSTIMQLIERFYDVNEGNVEIDGVDVKDLLLHDLRHKIGYVGQEPVLFATSIKENLKYGKSDASEEEMIQVLKEVNAWDFVSKMDKQLDTYVGIGGGQLSGGQKQRIAIARAILKRPKILLLDEATSALDKTNEKLIQQTLDQVSKGITTIIIAHRLTTIQNCDIIFVVNEGQVVESGTHDELMNKNGKYKILAEQQFAVQEEKDEEVKEEEKDGGLLLESPLKSPEIVVENNTNKALIQDESQQRMGLQHPLYQKNIAEQMVEERQRMEELGEVPGLVKKKSSQQQQQQQQVELEVLSEEGRKKREAEEKKKRNDMIFKRLFGYNKEEMVFFYLGIVVAMGNGCVFPVFSLFLAEMISVLSQSNPAFYEADVREQMMEEVSEDKDRIALWFFVIGCASLLLWACQFVFFSIVAENLTLKVRRDSFRKLLRMPIPFFDEAKNNAGTLSSRLSVDCKLINSLTSSIIGINIMNVSSLVCGMVIAFYASWALTLVSLALSPIVFLGGIIQAQFMQGFSDMTDSAYKDSGNLIMEAVCNVRTVMSFANEEMIFNLYADKVALPLKKASKKGIFSGLAFGLSQLQLFIIYAIVFYVGAIFHREYDLSVKDMFTSIFAIMFATFGMGNNAQFAGNIGEAYNAADNIFQILDAVDEYQEEENRKSPRIKKDIRGDIEIEEVDFKYESRDKFLFQKLSLKISAGNKVALVGPSGCGKSTIMQFLLRFYQPSSGRILLDGEDILHYDLRALRKQFAIVSQEPVLFNGTIRENIQYNELARTSDDIYQAAEKANALQFIEKNQFEVNANEDNQQMGSGFDRKVGPKGSQISGGQKQRIAIARAILRNSNVLLLDEATSALDSVTEQLVQQSLNYLMKDKTTIAIAHRISTIKDSNIIYVFEEGKIVEQGNYQDLVALKGVFYKLEQGIEH